MQAQQQHAQYIAEQEAEASTAEQAQEWQEQVGRATALVDARTAFASDPTNADWQQHDAGMNAFLQANPHLMASAAHARPAFEGDDQAVQRAVYGTLQTALSVARATSSAGIVAQGVEPHGIMGNAPTTPLVDPVAARQAASAEMREAGMLETGSANDVHVVVANPGASPQSQASISDLIGMETVS